MMRIAINGFGRIGRTVTRQLLADPNSGVEIALINDIAPAEMCAYLYQYDSVYGVARDAVRAENAALIIGDRRIPFGQFADLSATDLGDVDVVLECTGQAQTREVVERGLSAGASAVLVSGPSDGVEITAIMGVNANDIAQARSVSNASCTTNAIGPLLHLLEAGPGISQAHITTVHCYTGSQPMVDMPKASYARSRAGAVSMVPTTTSAAGQIKKLMPHLADRLSVTALRVPTISVSAIDAVITLSDGDAEDLLDWLKDTANPQLIAFTTDPCVSTDMRGRPESLVIAAPETHVVGRNQVRIFGWYDNEWGFSARMIDVARRMAARGAGTQV